MKSDAIHFGTVTRLHADGRPYVRVDRRAGAHEYGPANLLDSIHNGTTTGGDHSHGRGPALAAGNRVLVLFAAGDLPIVLGRLVY